VRIPKFFRKRADLLFENAKLLVPAAHASAVTMFVPMLDRFPALESVDPKHWDFILTVAAVFLAATRLSGSRIGSVREEKLMEIVAQQLNVWDADGILAFEDCKTFFEIEFDRLSSTQHPQEFVAVDALGLWIVWNAMERQPDVQKDMILVRTVGTIVVNGFFNWWKT